MKCLSIKQPWVELILEGKKKIELRTWNTKFRGEFLIHASKNVDKEAIRHFNFDPEKLPKGAIVGYARLVEVKEYKNERGFRRDQKLHLSISKSKKYPIYGFVLEDVRRIEPIEYKGRLGFFNVDSLRMYSLKCLAESEAAEEIFEY